MAENLLEFINVYRLGDVITIEASNIHHIPVSDDMGQKKYVNIALKHNEEF